jgi:hypothetical protein
VTCIPANQLVVAGALRVGNRLAVLLSRVRFEGALAVVGLDCRPEIQNEDPLCLCANRCRRNR